MATVRYKVMNAPERTEETHGEIISCAIDKEKIKAHVDVLDIVKKEPEKFIESADVLVVAGRGIKKEEDLAMIRELAELLDMDPNVLKKTIVDYNYAVECKNDSQFHRLTLDNKIDNPPYYANAKTVTVHQTLGGVEINENTQVLDKQGNIIKGLFACGEVTGGIHGANRLGGNSFPDSIVFGRIAGRNAALMQ